MTYQFKALATDLCDSWRSGAADANGQVAERAVSDGGGNPCRHCLQDIAAGQEMLILAHRPFANLNPYAEVGPIFICADCKRYQDGQDLPPVLASRARHLLKGYQKGDRIAYGTGAVVETGDIAAYLDTTFADANVKYIDIRSATNNCFTLRAERD